MLKSSQLIGVSFCQNEDGRCNAIATIEYTPSSIFSLQFLRFPLKQLLEY